MKVTRSTAQRFHQAAAEVERTPRLAAFASAVGAAAAARAAGLHRPGAVALPVATAAWWLARQAAHLDRLARNAEDATVLAARLGRGAPLFGRWAAEADYTGLVVREVERGHDLVVECGSGASTLAVAATLEVAGRGRLVSLEHDAAFADVVRCQLKRLGVQERVTVVDAPLEEQEVSGRRVIWYEAAAVERAVPNGIGVLIVDGPSQVRPWARWPAVEVFHDRLCDGASVYVDDGRTADIRAAVRAWARAYDDLERYWIDTMKGTWLLRRANRPRDPRFVAALAARAAISPNPVGQGRWPVRR